MSVIPITAGLHQLAEDVWAWLQPDGGWGLSNAGLIRGGDQSLLIDTLFDLPRTRATLDEMRPIVATSAIRYAVNTHGNGDHCYGNELLAADTQILAAPEATMHMRAESPALIAGMLTADLEPELSGYLHRSFGRFEFTGIHPRLPDHTVTADIELRVGDRSVRLLRSGPAHTHGDVAVHDPEQWDRVDLGPFARLGNPERVVITMDAAYRHLEPDYPDYPEPNLPALFGAMASWANARVG